MLTTLRADSGMDNEGCLVALQQLSNKKAGPCSPAALSFQDGSNWWGRRTQGALGKAALEGDPAPGLQDMSTFVPLQLSAGYTTVFITPVFAIAAMSHWPIRSFKLCLVVSRMSHVIETR